MADIEFDTKDSRSLRKPRQVIRPEKAIRHARKGWQAPPEIEDDSEMPRFQIWRQNQSGAVLWTVAPLGEVKDSLAIQLNWWSFGEPFEALDLTDAKAKARKLMLEEEECEQDEWLEQIH